MNKNKIIKEIEKRRMNLKSKGVKKIGLFGSYLKGTQKRGSDIDFLVTFEKENIGENYFKVLFYLEDLFKRKIDLIAVQTLRKELNYVKKEAVYVKINGNWNNE
ncbi:MAG: nucleotidyltransferase domain-containing protein [Nanoarchaeota archaeon]|nr:nucleotidyltransferase domain-containing protein [Nanoarchaeota archaeon]